MKLSKPIDRLTYTGEYFDTDEHGKSFSVAFRMEVELDQKLNFTGTVWEAQFSTISNEKLSVKGFIEDSHISFVVKYPCLFARNEKGQIFIDQSKEGNEVIYDGYWNSESNTWVGEWEVEGQTVLERGDIVTEVFIGTFEMKKEA